MERLVKDGILLNLDFSDLSTCVECVKGKLPFKVRKDRIAKCGDVLELTHIGIYGPFTPTTLGGHRYFITFTDDFSRYGHDELIREKSDSFVAFKTFKVKKWSFKIEVESFMVNMMKLDETRGHSQFVYVSVSLMNNTQCLELLNKMT